MLRRPRAGGFQWRGFTDSTQPPASGGQSSKRRARRNGSRKLSDHLAKRSYICCFEHFQDLTD